MSTPAQPPRGINLRSAVDLSGLARRSAPPPGAGAPGPGPSGAGASGLVVDVTTETFESVLALSAKVPVVLDLWATWCNPCKQLSPILEKLVVADSGRWLLAKIDVDAEQQIAAALRVQSLPTVLAVVGGRPVPLFQGALPEAQVRQVIDELLALAAENGINGRLDVGDGAAQGEPEEPALPPLHQQAYDALEAGDLAAAAEAYATALNQNPADAMATAGLAQVALLQRTETAPADAVAAADAAPDDIDLGLVAADVEVATGHVDQGFARLVALVRVSSGDDRDRVRARLVELFEVVGGSDERVARARRALASALF